MLCHVIITFWTVAENTQGRNQHEHYDVKINAFRDESIIKRKITKSDGSIQLRVLKQSNWPATN